MGKSDELKPLAQLLRNQRWAALSTLAAAGRPHASMVAYVVEPDFRGILLHLSRLAEHTGNLLERPAAALVVSEPDRGEDDPQLLARASLQGRVEPIARENPGFPAAREVYLSRLPDAAQLFKFTDFMLFRLVPQQVRFVGGFARAYSFGPDELARAGALSGRAEGS